MPACIRLLFSTVFAVFLAGCNAQIYLPAMPLDPSAPLSLAYVAVTQPQSLETLPVPASWFAEISGNCSEIGKVISVRTDHGLPLTILGISGDLVCQPDGSFHAKLDLTTVPAGRFEIRLSQLDTHGVASVPQRIYINKPGTACDTLANRQQVSAGGFAGGAGTLSSPYFICTADQLNQIRNLAGARYQLLSDIDFRNSDSNGDGTADGSDTDYRAGSGWTPIPNFAGGFDGGGFRINGLKISTTSGNTGFIANGMGFLSHLNLTEVEVSSTSSGSTGVLVGEGDFAILDVHVSGAVEGASFTGGIIGFSKGAVLRSDFTGTVRNNAAAGTGGIAGTGTGVISESKVSGLIDGVFTVGGIVGSNYGAQDPIVSNCYVNATVRGGREVGGIGGSYIYIRNSYSTGRVEASSGGNSFFGGLGAYSIQAFNSFTTMDVVAPSSNEVARLCGLPCNAGSTNNFYLSTAQCSGGSGCITQGTAQPASWFNQRANAPMNGWDWADTSSDGNNNVWLEQPDLPPTFWWTEPSQRSNWVAPFPGSGTLAAPYLISTSGQLLAIQGNSRWMDAYFEVQNPIDLSGATLKSIGHQSAFIGIWDGNSNAISDFAITNDMGTTGFFTETVHTTVHDVYLDNFSVTGVSFTGGVLGRSNSDAHFNLRTSNASVNGVNYIGGITGYISNSTFTGASASGTVSGNDFVGGMFGFSLNSSEYRLAGDVDVNGRDHIGGLFGQTYHASNFPLFDAYSRGDVTGRNEVGGIAGTFVFGNSERMYSSGAVTGASNVGGLFGIAVFSGSVARRSFATGAVVGNSGSNDVGSLAGSVTFSGDQSDNYHATGMSVVNNGAGGTNTLMSAGNAPPSSFYSPATVPLTFWNFTTIWSDNSATNAYPTLR